MDIGIEQAQVSLNFWNELNDEELDFFSKISVIHFLK
tara:strand:- start:195 stop:305 length:111 start_codon:yes stop_codon:yes gene_type:complete